MENGTTVPNLLITSMQCQNRLRVLTSRHVQVQFRVNVELVRMGPHSVLECHYPKDESARSPAGAKHLPPPC